MKEKSYEEFVEKFKPKKTTDDCYTPPGIYAVVRDWACKEYGIDPDKIVRPFYPGGDYEHYDYPEGAVVLDNQPFSILAKITAFYLERGIPFFLFAPSLTCFSARTCEEGTNHLICDANIVYENGAVVRTSFVTSYGGNVIAQTAPELTRLINEEAKRQLRETVKELPKYSYPDHVATSALMQKYARYGIDFRCRAANVSESADWTRSGRTKKRSSAMACCCLTGSRLKRPQRKEQHGKRPQRKERT